MKLDPFDIILPPVVASIFLGLGWTSSRAIAGGGPLSSHMKKMLFYSSLFVLGMGYSMSFVVMLGWPRPLWIVFTATWALLLMLMAWWRHRSPEKSADRIFITIAEGFPALILLIAIAGSAVQWEYILRGQGRLWVGLLWLTAAVAMIFTAGRERRITVIVVLRGIVALLVIGAAAERTPAAIIAAVVSGLSLLLLEKLWRATPEAKGMVSSSDFFSLLRIRKNR
jgi:hypothetical protein